MINILYFWWVTDGKHQNILSSCNEQSNLSWLKKEAIGICPLLQNFTYWVYAFILLSTFQACLISFSCQHQPSNQVQEISPMFNVFTSHRTNECVARCHQHKISCVFVKRSDKGIIQPNPLPSLKVLRKQTHGY